MLTQLHGKLLLRKVDAIKGHMMPYPILNKFNWSLVMSYLAWNML